MRYPQSLYGLAVLIGCLSSGAHAASVAEPAACKLVRMSGPGWTDIDSTNAMAGIVLDALGYRQSVANLSVPITFQGLKTGQLDVFLGNWMPAQKPLAEPLIKQGAIDVLGPNLENAKFTLAVPAYVAQAGISSFSDLAKHADKFDHKIYGIEPGAPANQNIKRMLDAKAFGLADWQLVESSETGMLTQVSRAVRNKKWIVFLAWEPHLMNTEFRLTYLQGGDAYFGPNYGGATVNTVTRHGYAGQCPNVSRLFGQMKFTVEMENRMISNVIQKKMSPKEAATEILKRNPALLTTWLNGVTTRTGEDGLPAVKKTLGL